MDDTGRILFELDSTREMPMASITKVMTAIVALDSDIALKDRIDVVDTDFEEDAQLVGYEKGDTPTFRELLLSTLVFSGNDAAKNVAIAVAGSEKAFADLMNDKLEELGLEHTHFVNSHGLEDEGHYSCTYDLCVIGRYAMDNYPFIRKAVATQTFSATVGATRIPLWTSDELMGVYEGMRGIKTGRVESGTGFLGSARRNGVTLYCCVLGCETSQGRFDDTVTLLDWGFDQYHEELLSNAGWAVRQSFWSDGFWLEAPTRSESSITAYVDNEEAIRLSGLPDRLALASSDALAGVGTWEQGDRVVDSTVYERGMPRKVTPAWSILALPVMDGSGGE